MTENSRNTMNMWIRIYVIIWVKVSPTQVDQVQMEVSTNEGFLSMGPHAKDSIFRLYKGESLGSETTCGGGFADDAALGLLDDEPSGMGSVADR